MRNQYEIRGHITAILLNKRDSSTLEALIDTKNLNKILEIDVRWYGSMEPNGCYYVKAYTKDSDGKRKWLHLHRIITSAPDEMEVDHKNHNPLVNLESNLAVVSRLNNNQNRRIFSNSTTGVRGVTLENGKWRARITINYKKISVGTFETKEKAERAVHNARLELMPYLKEVST